MTIHDVIGFGQDSTPFVDVTPSHASARMVSKLAVMSPKIWEGPVNVKTTVSVQKEDIA